MTAILDPNVAARLARICGMFGGNHDGERASAAPKADQIVAKARTYAHASSHSYAEAASWC